MLTHANFIADMAGAFIGGLTVKPNDVHISYLPLAHVCYRRIYQTRTYWDEKSHLISRFLSVLYLMPCYTGEPL